MNHGASILQQEEIMTSYDIESKLTTYRQACRKGTDWLLDHSNPDGSIGPVEDG